MKILVHGQKAFIAAWGREEMFIIGTAEGYSKEYNESPEVAVNRARKLGHDIAWTMKSGACITNSQGYYDRLRAEQKSAIEIVPNEIVLIEGREYRVKLMGSRYSDPVHFIPVLKVAA